MKKRTLSMLLILLMALTLLPTAAWAAEGNVPINPNFEDENFRTYVSEFDENNDGSLSETEIAAVKEISVVGKDITSLKGVEYFTALEKLNCAGNELSGLNVSANTALTTLIIDSNKLTGLDVSANTALKKLNCTSNKLTELDVSKNKELTSLICKKNELSGLNVSANTALENLNCASNGLSGLNVSKNGWLEALDCSDNQLTSLDVSKNTELTTLKCSVNQLKELVVSENTALTSLNCSDNQLTGLDVSANTKLMVIDCPRNKLTSLNVSKNGLLNTLYCNSNRLTSLDVSENPELNTLNCSSNNLTSLDLSKNTKLTTLNCRNNSYSITLSADRTFDLSKLPKGFDVSKATFPDGTVSENTLTFPETADEVTYDYDCGNGKTPTFKLISKYITLTKNSDDLTLTVANATELNDDDRIIVVRYDGDGKMISLDPFYTQADLTISESDGLGTRSISKKGAAQVKVFLISYDSCAPICSAAQWPAE